MDLSSGKTALLQALALMKDDGDLSMRISNLLDSIHGNKTQTVSLFCEALALQKQEAERKKKCLDLLQEVAKWWQLLVDDREKLLLTISKLEMEKEEILKRESDPNRIYGPLVERTLKKMRAEKAEEQSNSEATVPE